MAGLWYTITMSVAGVLILTGIVLTWLIQGRLEETVNGSRKFSSLLLIGGVTTAVGFAWIALTKGTPERGLIMTLILAGPAMIGYALSNVGFTGVSGRLLLQSAITLLSLLGAGHYLSRQMDIAYIGPFLAVLLLMNAQITVLEGRNRKLLIVSSWILVVFSWTRYLLNGRAEWEKALIVGPYLAAVVIWVAVLITIYRAPSEGSPALHS